MVNDIREQIPQDVFLLIAKALEEDTNTSEEKDIQQMLSQIDKILQSIESDLELKSQLEQIVQNHTDTREELTKHIETYLLQEPLLYEA